MDEKVSAKLFFHTKRILKNGIQKNTNHMMIVIHLKSAKSKAISIWLNTLWTMCQMIDTTIDVDRFF
jgi:hypothetical protein